MLPAKFHVVSRLLTVLKIAVAEVPIALPLKMSLTQTRNTVNLKSASFIVIMLSGLTQVHSQKNPRLHFGKSLALTYLLNNMFISTVD